MRFPVLQKIAEPYRLSGLNDSCFRFTSVHTEIGKLVIYGWAVTTLKKTICRQDAFVVAGTDRFTRVEQYGDAGVKWQFSGMCYARNINAQV